MKDKLENALYTAVFVWMCLKETVLSTPWMMFVLGGLLALGAALFFGIL